MTDPRRNRTENNNLRAEIDELKRQLEEASKDPEHARLA